MICMVVGAALGIWVGSVFGRHSYSPALAAFIFAIAGLVLDGFLIGASSVVVYNRFVAPKVET